MAPESTRRKASVPELPQAHELLFPGENLLNYLYPYTESRERLRDTLGLIYSIVEREHPNLGSHYHDRTSHIDPILTSVMAAAPSIRRLTIDGRAVLINAADHFSYTINGSSVKHVDSQVLELDNSHFQNETVENTLNGQEEDIILLFAGLGLHDIGRYYYDEEKATIIQRKANHESESMRRIEHRIFAENSPYRSYIQLLAEKYPSLFDEKHLPTTVKKLKYIVYSTQYAQTERQRDKFLNELNLAEEEKSRLQVLGALALSFDIGVMQIKPDTMDNFFDLIREYKEDDGTDSTTPTFCSIEDWILGWLHKTYPLSHNVYRLFLQSSIFPDLFGQGKKIVHIKDRHKHVTFRETAHYKRMRAQRKEFLDWVGTRYQIKVTDPVLIDKLFDMMEAYLEEKKRTKS
ncbi:hypothetical protein A2334_01175 [Candidatus Roizmanbacteria bacterium RIFOXYB2_FULL_38_10]|uniref:Uncharacterized protein n=1 Tax=Candidatus Roizmanbacteria bacterium RIFOXYD1_FULL_38_12 TaxID=1802093 RepID=A0A1F7L1I6_9BACT|nr:MAG: hypothetical protein A3K47_04470 [Candidatus Roizmanbacteria bacterium RIFOXYA2_FULL_38_14]OGK64007.1 MAG: hypothetical protein A3K27_04470 [Candidatus Roizmanbacteria bacterium RIFOXYA1_FULL_37_12]OGK65853.1 MAG: hypothetical protein A3K38_04470 [Candidatus Roizmanbacteria bacterium RIFOXYB1_FULL_40_23]OGK68960.1 MAG: hypothetical protein A2334_01175 [Candidatus Roizmanbacteria bacterium RIFOXYB2_FULL_38_10]OGK70258.1 MAG: hypothetical protein A3K21_04475 [Candidatus Roizmanbacteria ba